MDKMGESYNIGIKEGSVKKGDKNYPSLLKKIIDAPAVLFWLGNWENEIFNNTLAVVGSRRMTNYGKRVVEEIIGAVAEQGITIVSGFMYGIDATAHRATIFVGGKTIAVLPCGTDIIHPAHQKELYSKIAKEGLIVSEYENGFPPDKWTYIKRNRIVAGLAQAVFIVEAAEKSGSLITAHLALKYKRKLFAVPGSVFSHVSKGTNQLIKENLAEPVLCSEAILSFFKKRKKGKKDCEITNLTERENKVAYLLKNESLDLDEIALKTKMSVSEISVIISVLEIKGIIKQEGLKFRYK